MPAAAADPDAPAAVEVADAAEVLANWDEIKKGEPGREAGTFGEVPENLPALLLARCGLGAGGVTSAPADIAERWLAGATSVIFITRGAHGALGLSHGGAVDVPPLPTTIVDTIGAGDAFMAGLLDAAAGAQLLGPASRGALAAVDAPTLLRLGTDAAYVAALTVSRAGAELPTRAEVRAAIRRCD